MTQIHWCTVAAVIFMLSSSQGGEKKPASQALPTYGAYNAKKVKTFRKDGDTTTVYELKDRGITIEVKRYSQKMMEFVRVKRKDKAVFLGFFDIKEGRFHSVSFLGVNGGHHYQKKDTKMHPREFVIKAGDYVIGYPSGPFGNVDGPEHYLFAFVGVKDKGVRPLTAQEFKDQLTPLVIERVE